MKSEIEIVSKMNHVICPLMKRRPKSQIETTASDVHYVEHVAVVPLAVGDVYVHRDASPKAHERVHLDGSARVFAQSPGEQLYAA